MSDLRLPSAVLPTRLTRAKPPTTFAFVIGLLLCVMGASLYWLCAMGSSPPAPWLVTYVVSGALFTLGVLILVLVVIRVFWGPAASPILELSVQPFPRGRSVKITVIQPGPADWKAYGVKLERLEETYKWDQRVGGPDNEAGESFRVTLSSRVVEVHELLPPAPLLASRGSEWRRTFECVLPETSPATRKGETDAVIWQVVVRGANSLLRGLEDAHEIFVA